MNQLVLVLFILPLLVSPLLLVLPRKARTFATVTTVSILSLISVYLYFKADETISIMLPGIVNTIIAGADVILLLYFGYIAIQRKSLLVGIMSVLQLGGVLFLLTKMPHHESNQILVDKLSLFMFLLINIVSGVIAAFAIQYIEEENTSEYRKRFFLCVIMWFIGVMNLIVSADNLEYFFLFFELTTLASYLLISFRKDEESVHNALTALWMNQIGGIAILVAMFMAVFTPGYGEITFSSLIAKAPTVGVLLPFALLAVAALIKGAQMPFSKWLLGAMVAPTPVSALLHSSTMVKIAPFVILRISPAIHNSLVADVIIGLTAFVFLTAAISALAQDTFKRILAFSTISLLGLMCLMAAIGSEVAVVAALLLIIFHGLSKCMLFLNAGIIERIFHWKKASDMEKLGEVGPFTSLIVAVGFMSLLLPPFGAFVGKWFSLETLGAGLGNSQVAGALIISAIAIGGAVMSLLYFKVMGLLIARSGEKDKVQFESMPILFSSSMYILLALIFAGIISLPFMMGGFFAPVASDVTGLAVNVEWSNLTMLIGNAQLPIIPLFLAFLFLPLTMIIAMFVRFKGADRAKEYMCGEKVEYRLSSFYFNTDKITPYFIAIGIIFFIGIVAVAVI